MAAWARWCFRHPLVVLVLWAGALCGLGAVGGTAGADYAHAFSSRGSDSERARELMAEAFPERGGDTDTLVWKTATGSVRDAAVRDRIEPALAGIAALEGVGEVAGPYAPGPDAAARISRDGRIAYARVTFARPAGQLPESLVQDVVDTALRAETPGLRVEMGGPAAARTQEPPAGTVEAVGVAAAAVVLFLAFGSLFATLLPLLTAVCAVGTGLLATMLLSHVTDVPAVAPLLGTLLGLGVGVDYALFIVFRHRGGLLRGLTPEASAVQALNTAGRAVLFAGGTVCVALAGMLVMNMRFLDGVALTASLTVVLSVLAAVTLLPALFGVLGTRVLSRRRRHHLAVAGPDPREPAGLAARWSAYVEKRPRAVGLLALAAAAVLAVPLLSLRLGAADQGDHRASGTRQAYDLLAEGFGPGASGPLNVVVERAGPAGTDGLVERIRATDGVAQVASGPPADSGTSLIQVVPATSPRSAETGVLVDRLRDDVLPDAGADAHVGGVAAVFEDVAAATAERLPYFVGVIVGLGFLLLLVAFRSLVVPLTAALTNLIAAAASLGLLVAVFQWGWGADVIGVAGEGPVPAVLPVVVLALLFGLATDHQVFLVSRMHEEWMRTGDNARAVRVGLAETGRVVTCAALVVTGVFAAFLLGGDTRVAVAGTVLAAAVVLDALLLRAALVPAAMHVLGRANWWLPPWLDRRVPHLAVEPRETPPPAPEELEALVAAALGPATPVPPPAGPSGPAAPAATGPCGSYGSAPPAPYDAFDVCGAPGETCPPGVRGLGPYVVHGFVVTPFGEPIHSVTLTLATQDGRRLDRVSSLVDGSYILAALAPGVYVLAATAPGYASKARHIMLGNGPLTYDLELVEAVGTGPPGAPGG
ncbi:MMPL family transporter [Streptomyces sp. CC224B]|uniref:MMPL family transporter n=1 Tax=Streptomyces sp. CC224B TaxID=3044571 RepID=UPI0024A9D214|nr:MMPL family transporter [Streptomyces sp. CC224B]